MHRKQKKYYVNGVEVTREEYEQLYSAVVHSKSMEKCYVSPRAPRYGVTGVRWRDLLLTFSALDPNLDPSTRNDMGDPNELVEFCRRRLNLGIGGEIEKKMIKRINVEEVKHDDDIEAVGGS